MLTGYRKNLIADNFTNCNLILGKQITEITSARQDLSSAFYTECNDSFSDDTVKTTYSNMSAICTDLYNANVENSIDLGRTRTRLYVWLRIIRIRCIQVLIMVLWKWRIFICFYRRIGKKRSKMEIRGYLRIINIYITMVRHTRL